MGLRQTTKISETHQGEKASTKSVMLHGAEDRKLGDGKSESFKKLTRSHEGGVNKLFKTPITYNNGRVDTTKTTNPTNPYNLLSTLLSPLNLQQCQLRQ